MRVTTRVNHNKTAKQAIKLFKAIPAYHSELLPSPGKLKSRSKTHCLFLDTLLKRTLVPRQQQQQLWYQLAPILNVSQVNSLRGGLNLLIRVLSMTRHRQVKPGESNVGSLPTLAQTAPSRRLKTMFGG